MNYRIMEIIFYSVIMIVAFVCASKAHTPEDVIAATLILESGGEYSLGSMQAVHEVIVNRSIKRRISKAEVCLQ